MKKDSRGFSLIELLIVVAIILIIAAIAIPNLLKSRMAANQASAVGSLRAIDTAEITYASTYNTGFSPTLAALGPPASGNGSASAAGMIDSVLAAGSKAGYSFVYAATPDAGGEWTDDGSPRERRQLKHRAEGDSRIVPTHPELTRLLRDHLAEVGTSPDGRLFGGVRGGELPPNPLPRYDGRGGAGCSLLLFRSEWRAALQSLRGAQGRHTPVLS